MSRDPEQQTIDVGVQRSNTRPHARSETIARGAFADALDADVRARLNRGPNEVLGRTNNGTLMHDEPRPSGSRSSWRVRRSA